MTDRIVVSGIEVFAHHGVLEDEKENGQLFTVDVELELDLRAAQRSDDLADTVDYGALAEQVHRRVAEERWNLIETVAGRVSDLLLEDPRVSATTVTVHKPHAPIGVQFGDAVVTVHRSR